MTSAWDQSASRVRLEWGSVGAREIAAGAVCVLIDVLSFTTTLSVAVDRGVVVHPYAGKDEAARDLAARLGATFAVGRSAAGPGAVSLSPGSVRRADALRTLVLPSPNGSSISHLLAGCGIEVVGSCLRNRAAVVRHLARRLATAPDLAVALVPAAERWPDGTLRPAVEDLWGAGAVVAGLLDLPTVTAAEVSEEAHAAAAAYRLVEGRLLEALLSCSSGRELVESGYAEDVAIAAELDASSALPVLGADGAFRDGWAVAPRGGG